MIPCEAPNDRMHWPYQGAPSIVDIEHTPSTATGDFLIKASLFFNHVPNCNSHKLGGLEGSAIDTGQHMTDATVTSLNQTTWLDLARKLSM